VLLLNDAARMGALEARSFATRPKAESQSSNSDYELKVVIIQHLTLLANICPT
jgi:hypothetical protein